MRKSRAYLLVIGFAAAFASFASASLQTTVPVPPLAGRVNDLGRMLDPADAAALEAKLADYEKATGNQLVLLTDRDGLYTP